jgi:AcrR family transcriptional regulator
MKERILAGSQELFFRFGIRSITMDDIAKHLGISKKTIYQFFKDKDEVVLSLMKAKLEEDECDISKIQKDSKDIVNEIFSIMGRMSDMFSKINPTIFYDLQKYHPEVWKLFKDFKFKFILGIVEKTIIRGIKDKLVRSDVNPEILSRLRMEEIEMGFNPDVFPLDRFKLLEVQLAMTEHFLYGICTLKGYELIELYKKGKTSLKI